MFSPTDLEGLGFSVGLEIPSYGQRDQSYKTGKISGTGIRSQGAVPQRALGSTMVPNPLNLSDKRLSSVGGTQIPSWEKGPEFRSRGIGRSGIQSQGARPKETTSFIKQPLETNGG